MFDEKISIHHSTSMECINASLISNEVVEEGSRSRNSCLVFNFDFEGAYDQMS